MKKLVSTLTLVAVLTLGVSQTHAGIIVSTVSDQQTQSEYQKTGIIVATLTGIFDSIFGTSLASGASEIKKPVLLLPLNK